MAVPSSYYLDIESSNLEVIEKERTKLKRQFKYYKALLGKLVNCENPLAVKLRDNVCKIVFNNSVQTVSFKKCYIFDSSSVDVENKLIEKVETKLKVIDSFELSGMSKNYIFDRIETSSDFAKELYPYNSGRVKGSDYVTDCKVVSYLDQAQLREFEFSDTMVRFKLEKVLLSHGFLAKPTGVLKSGDIKYARPVLKHVERKIINLNQFYYADSGLVKFVSNRNIKDLLADVEEG